MEYGATRKEVVYLCVNGWWRGKKSYWLTHVRNETAMDGGDTIN